MTALPPIVRKPDVEVESCFDCNEAATEPDGRCHQCHDIYHGDMAHCLSCNNVVDTRFMWDGDCNECHAERKNDRQLSADYYAGRL